MSHLQEAHVITGATGFVGSALALELLARTEVDVVCVVRAREGESAHARLFAALHAAAAAYEAPAPIREAIERRCFAVEGDVERPFCGVTAVPPRHYTQFWHSAASLRFEDRFADEITAVNVGGTRNTLAFAAEICGTEQFNYMSTAYVVGGNVGRMPEASVGEIRPNNHYEASKIEAERLVENNGRFLTRIFRPSIVIGHSRTQAATNFTGMYGFLRKLHAFKGMMARTQSGLLQDRSMGINMEVGSPINIVPIDLVTEIAVRVATLAPPPLGDVQYYHLTNPTPPMSTDVMSIMFDVLELRAPTFKQSAEDLDWLDRKFNERIDFYRSYLHGDKTFARDEVIKRLPHEQDRTCDMSRAAIERYIRWYSERLDAERATLPETR